MSSDIIYNKIAIIERCIKRITDVYDNNSENLNDYTKQDSIILNIQRACEASIDLAMHIISSKRIGLPQNSRDAFEILYENNMISNASNIKLKRMVGFRNIAVHDYQNIQIKIIENIINHHLKDFNEYISQISQLL